MGSISWETEIKSENVGRKVFFDQEEPSHLKTTMKNLISVFVLVTLLACGDAVTAQQTDRAAAGKQTHSPHAAAKKTDPTLRQTLKIPAVPVFNVTWRPADQPTTNRGVTFFAIASDFKWTRKKAIWACFLIFLIASIAALVNFDKASEAKKQSILMSATKATLVENLQNGPAEVAGRVIDKHQFIRSPWNNRRCAYYRFHVEEYSEGSEGGGTWETYFEDAGPMSFVIADETGEIEILAHEGRTDLQLDRQAEFGKENEAPEQLRNLLKDKYGKFTKNHTLRFREYYLEHGDQVYVFGQASQTDTGRWEMGHGEMPLIVSENGELAIENEIKNTSSSAFVWAWLTTIAAVLSLIVGTAFLLGFGKFPKHVATQNQQSRAQTTRKQAELRKKADLSNQKAADRPDNAFHTFRAADREHQTVAKLFGFKVEETILYNVDSWHDKLSVVLLKKNGNKTKPLAVSIFDKESQTLLKSLNESRRQFKLQRQPRPAQ